MLHALSAHLLLPHPASITPQARSLRLDFGIPTVKQTALGGSPPPLPGGGSLEGVCGEGRILDWGGAVLVDLGVQRYVCLSRLRHIVAG